MSEDKKKTVEVELTDERIADLEDAVCWFAQSLVEAESDIIMASHMGREACYEFIQRAMPITIGIAENKLICDLGKHSRDVIPMELLKSILAEKEDS